MDSLLRRADTAILHMRETVRAAREARARFRSSRALLRAGERRRRGELDRIRRRYSRLVALARISCGAAKPGGWAGAALASGHRRRWPDR